MEDFDLVPLDKRYIGQFFAGDCYVILYTYQVHGRDNYIVYYWQVSISLVDMWSCDHLICFYWLICGHVINLFSFHWLICGHVII